MKKPEYEKIIDYYRDMGLDIDWLYRSYCDDIRNRRITGSFRKCFIDFVKADFDCHGITAGKVADYYHIY